jgi:hypothetical protein
MKRAMVSAMVIIALGPIGLGQSGPGEAPKLSSEAFDYRVLHDLQAIGVVVAINTEKDIKQGLDLEPIKVGVRDRLTKAGIPIVTPPANSEGTDQVPVLFFGVVERKNAGCLGFFVQVSIVEKVVLHRPGSVMAPAHTREWWDLVLEDGDSPKRVFVAIDNALDQFIGAWKATHPALMGSFPMGGHVRER